jgi:SAM-dependent methyltransferase
MAGVSLKQQLRSAANFGERSLLANLRGELVGCQSVLDVGCGRSSVLEALPRVPHAVGVDAYEPALEESRWRGIHDEYIQADVTQLGLSAGSFDAVLIMDLIEHLEHEQGKELIERMGRAAARKLIIFTPNGFVEQDEYDGNPLQIHRSGWTVDDFKRLGFRVVGAKGWSRLRGLRSTPRRPTAITRPLLSISQPIVERRPRHAYALLAIRDLVVTF